MVVSSARGLSWVIAGSLLLVSASGAAQAPEARSAPLAKELVSQLEQRKLDAVAARHPAAPDQFVAALYFPGQLLVIWARYSAPALLTEKLARGEFREVYIDLNSASDPDSRVMITDSGADGLRPRRERDQAFDMKDAGGAGFRFDGNWREVRISEQEYMKRFAEADEAYSVALEALLGALRPMS